MPDPTAPSVAVIIPSDMGSALPPLSPSPRTVTPRYWQATVSAPADTVSTERRARPGKVNFRPPPGQFAPRRQAVSPGTSQAAAATPR
ncbi:hypothetical protein GCM10010349_73640 [Streptomyces flavofungini]|nr:hypothetical protein GCM10010349_73640 [Streptomyces flavofungini]